MIDGGRSESKSLRSPTTTVGVLVDLLDVPHEVVDQRRLLMALHREARGAADTGRRAVIGELASK